MPDSQLACAFVVPYPSLTGHPGSNLPERRIGTGDQPFDELVIRHLGGFGG